ncbi:MAG: TetR/AcrR family transcriptional regulator [Bacteroidales bacterium]|jgi:AcrR family transcriptional regulator|nr:TetR/AcrR family transcriptional regulator [Bacteroidales bacterium]MBQ5403341.1 TetR/AcrR family transcriptional regulator [Bacteroidales bacterium]
MEPNETLKKNKNRDSIIRIARQVFNKYGYDKTRMEHIAKASGKGKSSIYYYFKSKEQIFQSVVLKEAVAFRHTIIDALAKTPNPVDKIKVYVLTRMNIIKIYTNFHSALKNSKLRHLDFVRRLNSLYDKEEIRLFKDILEEGVKKNYFNVKNLDLAAMALIMAVKGIEDYLFRTSDAEEFTSRIDQLLNLILHGIII